MAISKSNADVNIESSKTRNIEIYPLPFTTLSTIKPDELLWKGNIIAFCYRNGDPLFTIGPDCIWFIIVLGRYYVFTNIFIIGLSILSLHYSIGKVSLCAALVGILLLLIQVLSYLLTAIINPGLPSKRLLNDIPSSTIREVHNL